MAWKEQVDTAISIMEKFLLIEKINIGPDLYEEIINETARNYIVNGKLYGLYNLYVIPHMSPRGIELISTEKSQIRWMTKILVYGHGGYDFSCSYEDPQYYESETGPIGFRTIPFIWKYEQPSIIYNFQI